MDELADNNTLLPPYYSSEHVQFVQYTGKISYRCEGLLVPILLKNSVSYEHKKALAV